MNLKEYRKEPGIYILYCKPSDKYYVGETNNVRRRVADHFRYGTNQLIHLVIKKYGFENFKINIVYLSNFSKEDRVALESVLIKLFNSVTPNGYNICKHGTSQKDRVVSEETKRKISESHTRRGPVSEETKRRTSESSKGHLVSASTREKISKANKGRYCRPYKMVKQIDALTGDSIKLWSCYQEANLSFSKKRNNTSICKVCLGYEKTAFGYKWEYA